jgi:hypothetical protein
VITGMIAARTALLLNLQKKRLETVKGRAVVVVENSRRAVLVEDRRAFD